MDIDPQDSTTSEFLQDCCWPEPELFFQHRIVSVSARVPAADNPDKEPRLQVSSMDSRSGRPARSAGDYRLYFSFTISATVLFQPPQPFRKGLVLITQAADKSAI